MKSTFFLTLFFLHLFFNLCHSQTWTQQSTGIYGGDVQAIISQGDVVLAATDGAGVFRSEDAGSTWAKVEQLKGSTYSSFAQIGDTLFTGGLYGLEDLVYYSVDSGLSWDSTPTQLEYQIRCLEVIENKLFAGSFNGLQMSNDQGETWLSLTSRLPEVTENQNISSITHIGGNIILGGGNSNSYISSDMGDTWELFSVGSSDYDVFCGTQYSDLLYLGTQDGLYVSEDEGSSWNKIGTGLPETEINDIKKIDDVLYVATRYDIYSSHDKGSNWVSLGLIGLDHGLVNCIHLRDNEIFVATSASGVVKSIDNGNTWTCSNNNLTAVEINKLLKLEEYTFAHSRNNLYRSSDGINWTVTESGAFNSIEVKGDSLISTRGYEIYFSVDYGESWNNFPTDGLPTNKSTYLKYIDKYNIYLTAENLYIFNGQSWEIVDELVEFDQFDHITKTDNKVYTSIKNDLYYSTDEGITWQEEDINELAIDQGYIIDGLLGHNNYLHLSADDKIYTRHDSASIWSEKYGHPNVLTLQNIENYVFSGMVYGKIRFTPDFGTSWIDVHINESNIYYVNSFLKMENSVLIGTNEGVWASPITDYYPEIQSISPTAVKVGDNVTVTGINFSASLTNNNVTLNGEPVEALIADSQSIIFKVPETATSGKVVITLNGIAAESEEQICVIPETPIITASEDSNGEVILTSNYETGNQWFLDEVSIDGANEQSYIPTEYGIYTVQVEEDCVSEFAKNYEFALTLGLQNQRQSKIFPNPSTTYITIELRDFSSSNEVEIRVYNTASQLMNQQSSKGQNVIKIDMKRYDKGIYIIHLAQGEKNQTSRIIKN